MPRKQRTRRRYPGAVYGSKDWRFPKRDPEIEAMYPEPASAQMLKELLWRRLALERYLHMQRTICPSCGLHAVNSS
jgi:hypothetical protein